MARNSVEGLDKVQKEFNNRLKRIKNVTTKSLIDVAMKLKETSIPLAPIDTGNLRGSTYVNPISPILVEMGYKEEYAIIQHENLDFNHPRGGQAKYLEQPFKENLETYIAYIANKARRETE
jgi:hypothetical protein